MCCHALNVTNTNHVSTENHSSPHHCLNSFGRNLQLTCVSLKEKNSTKTTSETVVSKLMSIFTQIGIPEELITDNGQQFASQQFKNFMSKYDIQHTTSCPYYPQANRLAKCSVRTAKSILRQPDPQLALLSYKDSATEPTKESLARLLMGRRLRTTVPKLNHLLRPAWPDL